jgi:N-acyl-D-amino-acid deacylase
MRTPTAAPAPAGGTLRATLLAALAISAAASLGACGPSGTLDAGEPDRPPVTTTGPYDWLISGGTVIDGTGAPGRVLDVLVQDGRVAYIGIVDADTLTVEHTMDATGLVVAPGFIDAHAHWAPPEPPDFTNFLAMGVTTIVLGQDGGSPEVASLPAHLNRLEAERPRVNVAYLVGHNTIRMESGVGYDAPDAAGLERMAALVDRAMAAGAFGLSTGLEYDPGVRATMDELVAIARPVAARDGVVMSHMRNEDADQVEASLEELLEQGRRSGARVHASHMKVVLGNDPVQARRMLASMEEARRSGVAVTGDVYPYTASFTGLSILFPEWARPPHDYAVVSRERRADLAAHLRSRVETRNGPQATLFGSGPYSGKTLAEAAAATGKPFEEVLIDLGPSGARAAYFVMNDDVMRTFLADPHVGVSSDGSPTMAHPRGYGTFARIIRDHVVERSEIPLEEAVRKMSGHSASLLGLDDPARVATPRGYLRPGFAADLLVFDPAAIRDRADFENPHRLSDGMTAIWIAGRPAWLDGAPVEGQGHGAVLRNGTGTTGTTDR